ncbi:MAG: hypothetical protein ABWY20_20945 [Mycobacterium sp.]
MLDTRRLSTLLDCRAFSHSRLRPWCGAFRAKIADGASTVELLGLASTLDRYFPDQPAHHA